VAPKQSTTLEVDESHPLQTTVQLDSITSDDLELLLKDGSITPEIEEALRKILDQKAQLANFTSEAETREASMSSIYDDQQRLRENLKSAEGQRRRGSLDAALHQAAFRPGDAPRKAGRGEGGVREEERGRSGAAG
jgi:hypothetical protein